MKRKLIALFLAVTVTVLSVCACSKKESSNKTKENEKITEEVKDSTAEQETDAETKKAPETEKENNAVSKGTQTGKQSGETEKIDGSESEEYTDPRLNEHFPSSVKINKITIDILEETASITLSLTNTGNEKYIDFQNLIIKNEKGEEITNEFSAVYVKKDATVDISMPLEGKSIKEGQTVYVYYGAKLLDEVTVTSMA